MAFLDQVRRTQEDAKVMFDMIHAILVPHVRNTSPEPTGIVLALIDQLVIWSVAMKASRSEIINGINLCWKNAEENASMKPTDDDTGMSKHVN